MRYVKAELKEYIEVMTWRIYVTDGLYILSRKEGEQLGKRYKDIINPKPQDNRTGDEILADLVGRGVIKVT